MIDLSSTDAVIPPDRRVTPERLATMWPEASRRLLAALEAQGVDPANAEDLVSEAVTRALAVGLAADSVDDFCRWAYRVARNLHVDWMRARSRLAPESEAEDCAKVIDITDQVELRLLCESALRSLAELSASDRRAILGEADAAPPADRREAVKLAVRKHRARARLLKLVGGLGAAVGWLRTAGHARMTASIATTTAAVGVLIPSVALPFPSGYAATTAPPTAAAPRFVMVVVDVVSSEIPAEPALATVVTIDVTTSRVYASATVPVPRKPSPAPTDVIRDRTSKQGPHGRIPDVEAGGSLLDKVHL